VDPPPAATGSGLFAGTLLVLLAAIGFSAKAVIIKIAYAYPVDAGTLLALRMLFSAPLFVLMALWSGRSGEPLSFEDWKWVGILGFSGYYLASYLDFLGLVYVTASLERLILFLYPTIVVLLSAWLLKTPVRRHDVAALVLSYGGIALVFRESLGLAGDPRTLAIGGALVFASGLIYSFYLIGVGAIIAKMGSARFTAYAMLVACAACIIQFLVTHRLEALSLPMPVYALSLLMAVVSTVLPAWFMSEGIRRVGANRAAMAGSVGPVATIFLGYWMLDEAITAVQLIGVALVLAGVTLVSVRKT
jgi:drug/metabolite transporter (DMT)-like permease